MWIRNISFISEPPQKNKAPIVTRFTMSVKKKKKEFTIDDHYILGLLL